MKTVVSQPLSTEKPAIVAHRGGSLLAPENTLAAFKNALKLGVDRIELDVQFSSDHEVVVIHDEKLNRTTNGKGNIIKFTRQQLSALDAGIKFSEKFAGEKIPTLDEVLDLVDGACVLLIEIKSDKNSFPELENEVVNLLHKHNALSWCVVQSFNYESVLKVHTIDPEIKTGILFVKPPLDKIEKGQLDVSFISEINIYQRFAGKKTVARIHQMNKKTFVWTANKPERMQQLIKNGADGIMTDDPATLKNLLHK